MDTDFSEIGSTGLNRANGFISEEFLRELQGINGTKIYKEMRDNDPIIGAMLFAIKMLIRQVDWRVQSASDALEDLEVSKFIEESMHDMSMSWHDTISEILSMLVFGWSYHEIILKKRSQFWIKEMKKKHVKKRKQKRKKTRGESYSVLMKKTKK